MLIAAIIISMVWEMMCLAPRVSQRSTPTWGMPALAPSADVKTMYRPSAETEGAKSSACSFEMSGNDN